MPPILRHVRCGASWLIAIALGCALALAATSRPARASDAVVRMPSRGLPIRLPATADDSTADEREPLFYRGLPYGSESLVNPARLIVNGGFGILQFDGRDNRFAHVAFRRGWNRVWTDLRHPVTAIEVAGWKEFLQTEVLPVSTSRKGAQYWPNYTLHLVGGGMSWAEMSEWYDQHGFEHPSAWAGATLTVYHVLNEVVENDDQPGPTTDAITDLLLFDPAGVLLFSRPGVRGFFGRTLHLRDWSNQPAIDFAHGSIENQGQNFSIKWCPGWCRRWSVFYYFGNHGEGGVSFTRPNGSSYSIGAGLVASKLVDLGQGERTAELLPSAGFFYDRNGSLLFSVMTSRSKRNRVRVNVYPGLVRVGGVTAGAFVLWNENGVPAAGVTLPLLPLGVAFKR